MATPTFTLPTSGSDPKRATKEGLEENINSIIQYLDNARISGDAALMTGLEFQGGWDASTGLFPDQDKDGNPITKGDFFWVAVEGTFGGETYSVNEPLVATVDNPSTSDVSDWYHAPLNPSLVPILSRINDMAVPFDTVADLLADTTTLAAYQSRYGTTGTVNVKAGVYDYTLDLSQAGSGDGYVKNGKGVRFAPAGEVLPQHFNAALDGSTDDIVKLQAYADYLATIADTEIVNSLTDNERRPTFRIPAGSGAVITSPLTIKKNINVIMDAPILVSAAAGATDVWVHVANNDGTGNNPARACKYVVDVRRLTLSDWSSENDIGFQLDDAVSYEMHLKRLDNFCVGAKVSTAYSDVLLGEFRDCKKGVVVNHSVEQFTNAVNVRGGEFAVINGSNNGKSRYGIEVKDGGLGTEVNSVRFTGQSFELNEAAAKSGNPSGESIPYLLEDVTQSEFLSIRAENTGSTIARLTGDCRNNHFTMLYGNEVDAPTDGLLDDQSTYKLFNVARYMDSPYKHVVFDSGLIGRRVTYANAASSYTIAGMEVLGTNGGSGTAASKTNKINLTGNRPNDDGSISTTSIVGVTVNTKLSKNFVVEIDKDDDPSLTILAYDENGDQLTGSIDVLQNAATPTNTANTAIFGGFYSFTSQFDGDRRYRKFTFSENVREVFIGVSGTNVRSLRIYSVGAVTTSYTMNDDLSFIGRTERTPLQGNYVTGQVVFYDNAAAGASYGYYVTQGGHLGRTETGSPTAATTSGSSIVTLTDPDRQFKAGMYINIAGVSGVFRILARQGSWVKIDGNAGSTVASGAVTFAAPITKALASIAS